MPAVMGRAGGAACRSAAIASRCLGPGRNFSAIAAGIAAWGRSRQCSAATTYGLESRHLRRIANVSTVQAARRFELGSGAGRTAMNASVKPLGFVP